MKVRIGATAADAAGEAATWIAELARDAVARRGICTLALSGGSTPRVMFRALVALDVPWHATHLVQVDERVAPRGDPERNLTAIEEILVARTGLEPGRVHPMPVEHPDIDAVPDLYESVLRSVAGDPPVLDVVHLGLGADGHTASLIPGNPVVRVRDRDVALTGVYRGHLRVTLTVPALDRARHVVWLVAGADKAGAVALLHAADPAIPASLIRRDDAMLFADRAAAGLIVTKTPP